MTLNTVPGLWASAEGIEAKSGMERACNARMEFATSMGPQNYAGNNGPKNGGHKLG